MAKQSVCITRMIPEQTIDTLREHFDVNVNPEDALTREELLKAVRGRDSVVSLLTDKIGRRSARTARPLQCRIVANYAVGRLQFRSRRGRRARRDHLTNTPGVLDDATATHAWRRLRLRQPAACRVRALRTRGEMGGAGRRWRSSVRTSTTRRSTSRARPDRLSSRASRGVRHEHHLYRREAGRTGDVGGGEAFGGVQRAFRRQGGFFLRESDYLSLHLPLLPETHPIHRRRRTGRDEAKQPCSSTRRAVLVDESAGPPR